MAWCGAGLLLGGCACGYTGEAAQRWYAWQREEGEMIRALAGGECERPTTTAVRLWREAIDEDAPEGTINVWSAGEILYGVARRCPQGRVALGDEMARLEARLISREATGKEVEGWWRLLYLTGEEATAVRVVEASRGVGPLRAQLRYPQYRREDIQAAVRRAGREDLAGWIGPEPARAVGEGAREGALAGVGRVLGPVLGRMMAPR